MVVTTRKWNNTIRKVTDKRGVWFEDQNEFCNLLLLNFIGDVKWSRVLTSN